MQNKRIVYWTPMSLVTRFNNLSTRGDLVLSIFLPTHPCSPPPLDYLKQIPHYVLLKTPSFLFIFIKSPQLYCGIIGVNCTSKVCSFIIYVYTDPKTHHNSWNHHNIGNEHIHHPKVPVCPLVIPPSYPSLFPIPKHYWSAFCDSRFVCSF